MSRLPIRGIEQAYQESINKLWEDSGRVNPLSVGAVLASKHTHRWIIDSQNVGRCQCGEVKQFSPVLPDEPYALWPRREWSDWLARLNSAIEATR